MASSADLNSSSSTSYCDDYNCQGLKRIKRYKRFLFKEYDPAEVSIQTRRKYKLLENRNLQISSSSESSKHNVSNVNISSNSSQCNPSLSRNTDSGEKSDVNLLNKNCSPNNSYTNSIEICNYVSQLNEVDSNDQAESDNIYCNSNNNDDAHSEDSNSTVSMSDSSSDVVQCEYEEEESQFNKIMFEAAGLSVRDVILRCTALSLRFELNDEALLALTDLIKECAGPNFAKISFSKYMMQKCFSSQNENVDYHYYCCHCTSKIVLSVNATQKKSKAIEICENCKKSNVITSKSPNYFVTLNLEYQLKILFSNDEILDDVLNNLRMARESTQSSFKGSIEKEILKSQKDDSNEFMLTFNCNADGAPLTNSGKRSVTPLQLCLNNLSPKLKSRHVLLVGILVAEKEPKSSLMNLYFSIFVNKIMRDLYSYGMTIKKNNYKYTFKFSILSITVDTVCRTVLQNRLQFNGHYGCSWCYQYGSYVQSVHGIRYIVDQPSYHRSHESYLRDARDAENQGRFVNGVKGYSALSELSHVDMVWTFAFEYMHTVLLEVVFQLLNLWKSLKCIHKLNKKELKEVEKRYLNIKPTHDIHKLPRPGIIAGKMKPKASELKSWLLLFSLPCLKGLIKNEILDHFAILVKSIFTLLKENITESELSVCENDLIQFVIDFENLYGKEFMTFNVHALLHCVSSVRQTGLICINSDFPFENAIYTLKKHISGPKDMDKQIARKHLQSFIFKTNSKNYVHCSETTRNYCSGLFIPKRLTKFYETANDIILCGRKLVVSKDENQYFAYDKCIYKGIVYHSKKYRRSEKTDDSYVQLNTGKFYQIQEIILDDEQRCKLRLREVHTLKNPFQGINHIVQIKKRTSDEIQMIVSIYEIKCKSVLVNAISNSYLCTIPNRIEIQ